MSLRSGNLLAAATVLIFGLQGTVLAAAETVTPQEKAPISRSMSGVTVTIDPATGRLRQPTPEEARKLAVGLEEMVSQSAEGLVIVRHSNGMMSVNLQDRFQNAAVARVDPDGSVALGCVSDPKSAEAFRTSAAEEE